MKQIIAFIFIFSLISSCSQNDLLVDQTNDLTEVNIKSALVNTKDFKGVNWAAPVTNYSDGNVVPSGLDSSDNYITTSLKADTILSEFMRNLPGVNTVRMPINIPTVFGGWWGSYIASIDKALSKGMKVILAYWCPYTNKTHRVEVADSANFVAMWDIVVDKYKSANNVYFEIYNEPSGYKNDRAGLLKLYNDWIDRHYPVVPKNRIMLDGEGWASNTIIIGDAIPDCLLSLHNYPSWGPQEASVSAWESDFRSLIGPYGNRTVVTEFGTVQTLRPNMTTPHDYTGPVINIDIAYFVGATNVYRNDNIGSIFWNGIRFSDNDYNHILTQENSCSRKLMPTNLSGVSRLRYGWGEGIFDPSATYKIKNKNSGMNLDVSYSSIEDSVDVIQSSFWTRTSQLWQIIDIDGINCKIVNRNSHKSVVVEGGSTANHANVMQMVYTGDASEQWSFILEADAIYYRILNNNSEKTLSVVGSSMLNGAKVDQYQFSNFQGQKWQIIKQ